MAALRCLLRRQETKDADAVTLTLTLTLTLSLTLTLRHAMQARARACCRSKAMTTSSRSSRTGSSRCVEW